MHQQQDQAAQDHGHTQPLPHAHPKAQNAQMRIRLAEKLGDEAKHAVAQQEYRCHLALMEFLEKNPGMVKQLKDVL